MSKIIERKKNIRDVLDLKAVTFDDFIKACPYEFHELRSQSRKRNLTDWRHVAITVAFIDIKKPIDWGYTNAGRLLNRDHATSIKSVRNVTETVNYKHIVNAVRMERDKRLVEESTGDYESIKINHGTEAINMLNRINTTAKKNEIVSAVIKLRSYVNENINPNKL